MTNTAIAHTRTTDAVAFGNLFDIALLRTGAVQAEVCEACSTLNIGAPRTCKGCHHKLPAYYMGEPTDAKARKPHPLLSTYRWARTWDLVAFWLVMSSLAGATVLIPRVMA